MTTVCLRSSHPPQGGRAFALSVDLSPRPDPQPAPPAQTRPSTNPASEMRSNAAPATTHSSATTESVRCRTAKCSPNRQVGRDRLPPAGNEREFQGYKPTLCPTYSPATFSPYGIKDRRRDLRDRFFWWTQRESTATIPAPGFRPANGSELFCRPVIEREIALSAGDAACDPRTKTSRPRPCTLGASKINLCPEQPAASNPAAKSRCGVWLKTCRPENQTSA